MSMNYYVRIGTPTYDTVGNKNQGTYRNYLVECEPKDPKTHKPLYIQHTETYYNDTGCWESEKNFEVEPGDGFPSEYMKVNESDCHDSKNIVLGYVPLVRKKRQWKFDRKLADGIEIPKVVNNYWQTSKPPVDKDILLLCVLFDEDKYRTIEKGWLHDFNRIIIQGRWNGSYFKGEYNRDYDNPYYEVVAWREIDYGKEYYDKCIGECRN